MWSEYKTQQTITVVITDATAEVKVVWMVFNQSDTRGFMNTVLWVMIMCIVFYKLLENTSHQRYSIYYFVTEGQRDRPPIGFQYSIVLLLNHYMILHVYLGLGSSQYIIVSDWTFLLYYELREHYHDKLPKLKMLLCALRRPGSIPGVFNTTINPDLKELTAALLIRGVGAVDDLVAPGWAGYAAPILARWFRRAARDVCGEGARGLFAFQKDNGSSTRRQSQVQLRTMLRTSFRGRLKLAQGWKLPGRQGPVMNSISAVKLPGPCKLTERYDPN